MKKIIFAFLMVFVANWIFSQTIEQSLYYELDSASQTATLVAGGTMYSGDIYIPSIVTYNGIRYTVTSIGKRAFYGCNDLISVTIPNSVTSIGLSAFEYCRSLNSITIPESVADIGNAAFNGCTGLISVVLEKDISVSNADLCFTQEEIKYRVLNKNSVSVVSNDYFGDIVIPEKVTAGNTFDVVGIRFSAFYNCKELSSITIPESVTSIGSEAFSGCTSLTALTLPKNLTTIEDNAFGNCTSLTSITIPESVNSIGYGAFSGCFGLTSITIPESVNSIGWGVFDECDNLTEINFNAKKASIDGDIFGYRNNIKIANIGDSVEVIPGYLFSHCSNLTSVSLGESVKKIDVRAFFGCTNLTSINLPNTLISIEDSAFCECTNIRTATIPESVTSIGYGAFSGCTSLTALTLPKNLTTIEDNAFGNCTSLTSITIPESVNSIGSEAFSGCPLTSVTIEGDIDVSNAALYFSNNGIRYHILNNNSVEIIYSSISGDIIIPEKVMVGNTYDVIGIGNSAFLFCSGLTSIKIMGDLDVSKAKLYFEKAGIRYHVLNQDSVAVASHSYANAITIPAYVECGNNYVVADIESNAFANCINLMKVEICADITTIPSSAFSGCSNLKAITFPQSINSIGDTTFASCPNLAKITCLATTPPHVTANTFANYNATLYIPCESTEDYEYTLGWGMFNNVKCIGSDPITLNQDKIEVTPESNEAVFTMPTSEQAYSYTLTISNNGVTFCTLTFNAQGQLTNIDFSTNKSYDLKAGYSAYQFTVTGLYAATDYGYSFKALSQNKVVLKEYTGTFTTKNEDGTGGSSAGGEQTAVSELTLNPQAITIANNQVLINGDAPRFVTNTSAQKIANKNLKPGVYFIVVDGFTTKILIK